VIKALHESGVVPKCFDECSGFSPQRLQGQLDLADQPDLAESLAGSTTIASLSGATPPLERSPARALSLPSILPARPEWGCPNCGVLKSNTDLSKRAKFALPRPCVLKAGCFCEGLPPETEYCSLCVRWFTQRHQLRPKEKERARLKRRQSGTPGSSKRPHTAVHASAPAGQLAGQLADCHDAASVASL